MIHVLTDKQLLEDKITNLQEKLRQQKEELDQHLQAKRLARRDNGHRKTEI